MENYIDNGEKNNNRKKVLTAFLMLIVTAVSLTTASYAWFTENTTVSVSGIDVNVSAANGIQVSVDAVNWKAIISNAEITGSAYSGHSNQLPAQIVPVSSTGTIDTVTGFMNMYRGTLEADVSTVHGYKLVSTKTTEVAGTAGDFIAFDLFLLATQTTTVYLTTSSDVEASATDSGLKNAARMAFLYEGVAPTGATATATALHGATTAILWEPNSNVHTAGGIAQAANYGQTIGNNSVIPNYYALRAEILDTLIPSIDYQSTNATYFGQVTPTIQTPEDNNANGTYQTLLSLQAGINKVRIYGWVEGQDFDCENNASGSNITFNVQISKNATP